MWCGVLFTNHEVFVWIKLNLVTCSCIYLLYSIYLFLYLFIYFWSTLHPEFIYVLIFPVRFTFSYIRLNNHFSFQTQIYFKFLLLVYRMLSLFFFIGVQSFYFVIIAYVFQSNRLCSQINVFQSSIGVSQLCLSIINMLLLLYSQIEMPPLVSWSNTSS